MLQDYAEEWWIDNVFEELDAPNEFWFNASSGQLYLAYELRCVSYPSVEIEPFS